MTDDTCGELAVLRMETEILWPAKMQALLTKADELERELRSALCMLDLVDPWQLPKPYSEQMQFYRDKQELWATLDRLTAKQK